MHYQIRNYLEQEYTLIEKIFLNRGILPEDINNYLYTTDCDLNPPDLLDNVKKGAEILAKHIYQENDVFIQIDSDADGYTSSAILINYLHHFFPAFVENHIKYRLHKGKEHGIILDTIPEGIKLVIIPDAGSNDFKEHESLSKHNIDVLIIDHHEADEISKNACIINNQLCNYPNKTLSGAGVVYKFCVYMDELLGTNYSTQLMDLAALGIIADVMDLRDFETRHIIKKGLDNINNPFFKAMVEKQAYSLKGEISPFGVAFYIAPYINAMVRMGSDKEKTLLFESMLNHKAYELIPSTKRGCAGQQETRVEQAVRTCNNTKNHQATERDNNYEIIEQLIEKRDLLKNKILIVQLDKSYSVNKNLTGLIANQLMSKYQRPVLLLNEVIDEEGNIWWEGSGRGADKSALNNFREFLNNSCLIEYAQGQRVALKHFFRYREGHF